MLLKRFYDQGLTPASLVLGDLDRHEGIVVDSNRDVDAYLAAARAEEFRTMGSDGDGDPPQLVLRRPGASATRGRKGAAFRRGRRGLELRVGE